MTQPGSLNYSDLTDEKNEAYQVTPFARVHAAVMCKAGIQNQVCLTSLPT